MGGIGAEVHEDLLYLGGISEDETRLALDLDPDADGRGDRGPKELHGLLDDAAQTERFLLLLGLSAEGEHLPDELPAPEPASMTLSRWCSSRLPLGAWPFTQFGEPDDGREDVVEIVGDAAAERAEGLHLLGLAELLLYTPGLRDIEVDLQDCQRHSRLIPLEGLTAEHLIWRPSFVVWTVLPPSGLLWLVPPCAHQRARETGS